MSYEELIRVRKSTRKFSNLQVEKDKVLKILEAGNLAPTAKIVNHKEFLLLQILKS